MSKDRNLSDPNDATEPNSDGDAVCADFYEDLDISLAVGQHLASLQSAGISRIPRGSGQAFELPESAAPAAVDPVAAANASPNASAADVTLTQKTRAAEMVREVKTVSPAPIPTPGVGLDTAYPAGLAMADREAGLQVLASEVAACTRCPQLCEHRTQTVFGAGDPNSRLVFVGEGPGEQEDRTGQPFVGAAGQLLDKILAACGLSRDQVYFLNTVKCRPPQNRNPKPEELANCWNYGQQQLEILQPEFICCLGSVAAKTVLNTNLPVGKLRKQLHSYRGSKVVVTYHPAYLLRTSSAKLHAWNDMKMLMQAMGIEIPG